MATFKLQAGQEIVTLTAEELKHSLDDVYAKRFGGLRYFRFSSVLQADSSGTITGSDTGIGPNAGFVWSVKRLTAVSQNGDAAALAWFTNGNQTADIVAPSSTLPAMWIWSSNSLVLYPNDRLWIVASGLTANTMVTVTGQAEEVAANEVGKL